MVNFSSTGASNEKKLVFIMGPGHCGSTLLDMILGSHTQAFSLAEFHHISKLLYEPDTRNPNICKICGPNCEFWNKKVSLPLLRLFYSKRNKFQSFVSKAFRFFISPYHFLFKWTGKPVLIDSSKNPGWFRHQLASSLAMHNIQPYLIYLTRDGRAVVNSYNRKYPEKGIASLTQKWKENVESMNEYYNTFPKDRRIMVKYEDLATSPEAMVKSICDLIAIPYESKMLLYWIHDHHVVGGNAGTHSLIFQHREKFGKLPPELRKSINEGDRYYQEEYYENSGMAIKLDLRWKTELSKDQIEAFDSIAGDINTPFVPEFDK